MRRKPIRRYELTGLPRTELGRYSGAFFLILFLSLALIVRSIVWSPIFVLFALGGLYGHLHRAKPGWCVELQEDGILVNMVVACKIPYRDIRSADFFVYRLGESLRTVANASIAFGRLFGGTSPMFGKFGEVDRDSVALRFGRWRWSYAPFPPFLIPSRAVRLRVEDASGLLTELQKRLSH